MYEELRGNLMAQATHFSVHDETSLLLLKAADAIEELWKLFQSAEKDNAKLTAWYVEKCNKHKWIPVTERLPDNQCDVLCDDEGRVVVGYYTDEKVGWHDLHSYKIYPTHWMPLPEPPKDGEQ